MAGKNRWLRRVRTVLPAVLTIVVGGIAMATFAFGQPTSNVASAAPRVGAQLAADAGGAAPTSTSTAPSTSTSTSTTAPPPPPTTTTTLPALDMADQAPGWEQRRGEVALARINYDWRALGYTIEFGPARSGYLGMTYPNEKRITVWVRPDQSLDFLTHIVAHEMGHAVDMSYSNGARRDQYLAIRGISPRNWFTCNACTDFSTPAGDFAETFALWATGIPDFRGQIAPAPSPDQLVQLPPLFAPA